MKFWIGTAIAISSLLLYQNCSPFVSGTERGSSTPTTTAFALKCESNDPRNPSGSELKRLNKFELFNTLTDLFSPYMSANELVQFQNRISPMIEQIPDNRVETGMNIANQGVTQVHVEQHFLLSESVADFVAPSTSIMNRVLGSCASTPNTVTCRRAFLESFGSKVLRRPLSDEDYTHYLETMASHADSYRNVIAEMLSSPFFYYHSESGANPPDESGDEIVVPLDPYEIASKVSYFLLQSMPDSGLTAAAASGELTTPSGLSSQVNRLLADPKVRDRLTQYFANQWMHLDNTANLRLDIQEVQTRLNELAGPDPRPTLRQDLIEEVYDYFDYMIWEQQATFEELMTSNLVFPRSPAMASIYGTNQWNGSYNQTALIRAPESERSGLLTRAQFLFTGSGGTRPIIRGVHVYRDFMCQSLSLPPDNSTPAGVVITDDMTDQEVVRATTEVPGTACVGCHQRIINPIGFSFDNFDPFGKFRTQERVFHPEGSPQEGQVLLNKNVDADSTLAIRPFIEGPVAGAVDLSRQLAVNPNAKACFSSKLWNFAQKKNMRVEENPCAVKSIFESQAINDGSIIDALRTILLQPEFIKRKVE